jgi:hypothetical protein
MRTGEATIPDSAGCFSFSGPSFGKVRPGSDVFSFPTFAEEARRRTQQKHPPVFNLLYPSFPQSNYGCSIHLMEFPNAVIPGFPKVLVVAIIPFDIGLTRKVMGIDLTRSPFSDGPKKGTGLLILGILSPFSDVETMIT